MNKNLSLLNFCIPCKAKCCKTGKLIGSPILSKDEIDKIGRNENLQEITSPTGEKYFIIKEYKGTKKCFFLSEGNECKIQDKKPLDCLCYPIKAVYSEDKIVFITDQNCPAAKNLSKEFIERAREIALKSIKRFDKETYEHWLNNNVGWAKP